MSKYILIPGRHHVLTKFMYEYFSEIVRLREVTLLDGSAIRLDEGVRLVWAVTSSNHSNTRRNPFSALRRVSGIELFASTIGGESLVFEIPDIGESDRFAHFIINTIEVDSRGEVLLTPENTVVASSTPEIIKQFSAEGFTNIAPIELQTLDPLVLRSDRAWEVLQMIVAGGDSLHGVELLHESSRALLSKYQLLKLLREIYQDPLGGEEGDITETRDYETYRAAFDQGAERKYKLIEDYMVPGRIVDIGCATGSIIKKMSFSPVLRESDIYGVELARPLYERCMQSKVNGEFGNDNVFFYQRNILQARLFPDSSVHTTTSLSLTHEVDSYLGREALLRFIAQVYAQTAPGGVYINVDVCGPENGDELVYMWLNHEDGEDDSGAEYGPQQQAEYTTYLNGLSTLGRFKRFVRDFRAVEGDQIKSAIEERGGKWYTKLRLADASEFLQTKDYTTSWFSEMHERFCFWSMSDWKKNLEAEGFILDKDSYTFCNDWIVENRYKNRATLFEERQGKLREMEYPPNTVVLIARKQ